MIPSGLGRSALNGVPAHFFEDGFKYQRSANGIMVHDGLHFQQFPVLQLHFLFFGHLTPHLQAWWHGIPSTRNHRGAGIRTSAFF
jgi:hypothetical protein